MIHEAEKRPSYGLLEFENTLQVLKDSPDVEMLAPEAGSRSISAGTVLLATRRIPLTNGGELTVGWFG
jgi:hypothetical protein